MIVLAAVLGAVVYFAWPAKAPSSPAAQRQPASGHSAAFNKHQYSLSDPSSIWVVVNKRRPLNPINYAPTDLVAPSVPFRVNDSEMQLRRPAASALESMFAGAKAAGIPLMLSSGYRSYNFQTNLYNGYVASVGQAATDAVSARPGYSEHQTGLAADIEPLSGECDVDPCFANLPGGKWLAANAYKYGFIMRYPADKTNITGYDYEPWHFRYVGIPLSTEMHRRHIETLEEFFGLPAAPNY